MFDLRIKIERESVFFMNKIDYNEKKLQLLTQKNFFFWVTALTISRSDLLRSDLKGTPNSVIFRYFSKNIKIKPKLRGHWAVKMGSEQEN